MAEIRRQLDQEFSRRRDTALRAAEQKKHAVYQMIPELSDIDSEINLSGIRYARMLLSSDNSKEQGPDALEQHLNQLNRKKEALLLANGYSTDYLEPSFACEKCQDRGYITDANNGGTTPCTCYQKLYLEHLYEVSNLLDDGQTGFEYFSDRYFSDISDKKRFQVEISPRELIRGIKNRCLEFIRGFEADAPNLYFYGPTGTGKTFIAKSIGLELIKRGYSVLYLSAPSLFSIIHRYRLNMENEEADFHSAYKNLITVNLLILDDLGTEPGSDARYAELLTLLEMRKSQSKHSAAKTIISSNLDLKRLFQEYNERIASRIVGEFETVQFAGDDIRLIKKIENSNS